MTLRRTLKRSLSTTTRGLLQFGSGGAAPPSLLLDTYTGAAAAYSLRKLSSSYSGSAIRVRRASDSAEQDIGFSGNDLDTASLTSFCTGTDGFVTTWYDQSGNTRNATQTTTTNQPKVYDSSAGYYSYLRFDDTSASVEDHLIVSAWHTADAAWVGVFSVYQLLTSTLNFPVVLSVSGGGIFQTHNIGTTRTYRHAAIRTGGTITDNAAISLGFDTVIQRTTYANRTNIISRVNSTAVITTADADQDFTAVANYIIGNQSGAVQGSVAINELVLYATDQASNLSGIESDQISGWSIAI